MEQKEVINIVRKEKANSLEIGKTGQRYKLYFENFEELKQLLKEKEETDKLINKMSEEQ